MNLHKTALKISLFVCLSINISPLRAQLSVSGTMTPDQLVKNVLLGQGVIATNIVYTGNPIAIGYFNNGNSTNIGINSGIILTSGDINLAKGPNYFSGQGIDNGTDGDPDLDIINSMGTFDAAVLEFDFIPSTDTLRVRYVFASEEYNEFVCSNYNDVFGFFISGPGISGTKNIARIPNSTIPVAINSINNGNLSDPQCQPSNPAYYIDNVSGNTIEYDGFTVVMEAVSAVQPCKTYHIRLAIADVADHIYDSGVFLESQSFKSADEVILNATAGTTVLEQCETTSIEVTRVTGINSPLTIYCDLTGTAINGTDYQRIPDSITFLPGESVVTIPIVPFPDALAESTENILLTLRSATCSNSQYSLEMNIRDLQPLDAEITDGVMICPGESATIDVTGLNGSGNYIYTWSTGGQASTETVFPEQTQTYSVEVSDICTGEKKVLSATVFVRLSNVQVIPDTVICKKNGVRLYASGGTAYEWYPSTNLSDPYSSNPLAYPDENTDYIVTITSGSCIKKDTVKVTVNTLKADFTIVNDKCSNAVQFLNSSLNGTDYSWDFGDGQTAAIANPEHHYKENGEYTIRLVANAPVNCPDTLEQTILVESNIDNMLLIPNSFTPNNDGVNDVFSVRYTNQECKPVEFLIYNRWGELVYTNEQQKELQWDGTFDGNPAPEGAYIYMIRGQGYKRQGHVSLIR